MRDGLFKFEAFQPLIDDYRLGSKRISDAEITSVLEDKIAVVEATHRMNEYQKKLLLSEFEKMRRLEGKAAPSYEAIAKSLQTLKENPLQPGIARSPYHMTPDDPNDMVSGAAGVTMFCWKSFHKKFIVRTP